MTFYLSLLNLHYRSTTTTVSASAMVLLLALLSLGVSGRPAVAQTANVPVRSDDGSVRVDNNARDIRTGPLRNGSNIPLPTLLPEDTEEGEAIDVDFNSQAPNSIEIRPNVTYIEEALGEIVNNAEGIEGRYDIQRDSIQITTTFKLNRIEGQHGYAEGIQVTVISPETGRGESQTVFVRGGRVTRGPGGERLENSESIEVTSGADDVVELRVLNIRNNRAQPSESAVYFTTDFSDNGQIGEFIVEDLENGGDLDFNDGEYVQAPTGVGSAITVREISDVNVDTTTETVELPPFIDQVTSVVEIVVEEEVQTSVEETEIDRERGQVELSDETPSNLLGHARGVRTGNDEQLVYSRYASTIEARLGSDGLGATGQLRPLINNPGAPPTLLTGNLRFDPFADDNQAGLTSTLGVTQFLTRTHRPAVDVFGSRLVLAEEDTNLLVPTGLFNNRRMVGYVPAQVAQAEPLASVNGIFDLPAGRTIAIAPPDPQRVGRGESAYTDNVGGLIIEQADGQLRFFPQWTKDGYAQSPIELSADEASRIIYALVPQQPGQDLQIGQTYAVVENGDEYAIADGGFRIISADLQPQNFVLETAEVYAVEDTFAAANAATENFNGIQGVYAEVVGGEPVPTVDVSDAAEADARVGATLLSTDQFGAAGIASGQPGYMRVTRAGGLYLGGSLTGGLGNQEDTLVVSRLTTTSAVREVFEQRTVETFSSTQSREDITRTETGTVEQNTGIANFSINGAGELDAATFIPGLETITIDIEDRVTTETGDVVLGPRVLTATETTIDDTPIDRQEETSQSEETITTRDSYPNFSAVLGELTVGGIYNFGNTPWSAAANTVRAEVFYRDTVFGESSNDSDFGIRGEVVFHPFGEVKRDAYQVNAAGDVVPVYQTEAVLDADGNQVMETVTDGNGESAAIAVSQFVLDEAGDRIAQRVGTGRSRGPGAYLRVENTFDDGTEVAGGIRLAF